jgi:hypothetical protein
VLSAAPARVAYAFTADAIQMTPIAVTIFANGVSGTRFESEIVKPMARVATVPAKIPKNESHPTMKPAIGW